MKNNQNYYNTYKELLEQKILLLSYFYNQNNRVMRSLPKKINKLTKILNKLLKIMKNDKKYGLSVKTMLDIIEKEHKTYLKQKPYVKQKSFTSYNMTFESYIEKEIKLSNAQIFGSHKYGIETLKKQNKNSYIMITAFLKTRSYIMRDIKKILLTRNITKTEIKKIEKRKQYHNKNYKIPYLCVMEISPNNHIHFHFYIYNEIDIQTTEANLKQKFKLQNLQINLKTTRYKILQKDLNYSNLYHTIQNKMKGTKNENKIVTFVLKKLFSKNKLVTHSPLPFNMEFVKKEMKTCLEQNEKISYPTLVCNIVDRYFSDGIQGKAS